MLEVLIQKLLESFYVYYGLDWLSFGCGAWGMVLFFPATAHNLISDYEISMK